MNVKQTLPMDDLDKIDVRVGTIASVEDMPNSNKLVKLIVDFGDFKRQILVGMKGERDNPKEIEGQQALFVVNLAPRKWQGKCQRACSLISAMRAASSQYWHSQKSQCQTERK